jgi:hypothetical protein
MIEENGDETATQLGIAVEGLHNCRATFLDAVTVVERSGEKVVWQGVVYVFHLIRHSETDRCYAWYADDPETGKRRYYAVLHIPPVDSPEKAVRTSIVRDEKAGKS